MLHLEGILSSFSRRYFFCQNEPKSLQTEIDGIEQKSVQVILLVAYLCQGPPQDITFKIGMLEMDTMWIQWNNVSNPCIMPTIITLIEIHPYGHTYIHVFVFAMVPRGLEQTTKTFSKFNNHSSYAQHT